MTDTGRPAAYADLLAALLAVRSDPATARFDTELAAAEADGRIDGHTARTLRWWQRESLRGLAEHLDTVLPQLLTHLAASDRVADESVRESASSWDGAIASQVESVPPAGSLAVPETPSPEAYDRPFGAAHLRGKNADMSFVGVAFHGADENAYEVVYFRPFNFRSEDPARRAHV